MGKVYFKAFQVLSALRHFKLLALNSTPLHLVEKVLLSYYILYIIDLQQSVFLTTQSSSKLPSDLCVLFITLDLHVTVQK